VDARHRPFQILTLGIFLRTSYRISDVVARATGAVYRRAWRQAIYLACVVAGAWFGRHWGIAGVALGVLGALAVNYLLMAHLGLRLAGLSWRRFGQAHLHALLTAAVVAVLWGGWQGYWRAWALPPWPCWYGGSGGAGRHAPAGVGGPQAFLGPMTLGAAPGPRVRLEPWRVPLHGAARGCTTYRGPAVAVAGAAPRRGAGA